MKIYRGGNVFVAHQLLILGNGFDLHCGLKSSYNDFFRKTIIDTAGEKFGLIQKQPNVNGFWEGLLLEYYRSYRNSNEDWCVIEDIILQTLISVCIDKDQHYPLSIWSMATSQIHQDNIDRIINTPIKKYLFNYCRYYYNRLINEPESVRFNLFLAHLLQELYNFEKRFCEYLKDDIVNPQNCKEINGSYIINAVNLLFAITENHEGKFKSLNEIICDNTLSPKLSKLLGTRILSFNYTMLFDILNVKSPCRYVNVHGKLCKKQCNELCTDSSIIFGVDDKLIQSGGEYAPLRIFSKTYRKMMSGENPQSILPNNESSLEIKFYGHSLSEADYSYFQSIFDYYNLYGNNNVSVIFYYSEGYDQIDAIYRLVNSYGETLTNKDQGKNLIHKLLLENRLIIKKID